jgi:hypothetical protein
MRGLPPTPQDYEPEAGDYVAPDTWETEGGSNYGGLISDCDDWDAAGFRIDTGRCSPYDKYKNLKVAVDVEITSRTWRRHRGEYGYCRVKITFVKDCEPNETVRGWMYPHNLLS